MHRLTDPEGQSLTQLALVLRPDWVRNKPGRIFQQANVVGFEWAVDFAHMVRALLLYAAPGAGMRTPKLYPSDGAWWRDSQGAALTTMQAAELATGSRRARDILAIDTTRIQEDQSGHRADEAVDREGGDHRQPDRGLGYDHGVA